MILTFIIVFLIVFTGALTQGLTGFGFAIITVPLLSLIMDIKIAIPLGAVCGLLINLTLFLNFKKRIDINEIKLLMAGGLTGIPIGAFFLKTAHPELIKILLGSLILVFALFMLSGIKFRRVINLKWGLFFGFLSGVLGGAFNTNGPPVLIYSLVQGWDRHRLKASLAAYFLSTSIVIVISHLAAGILTGKIMVQFLCLLPAIGGGLIAGNLLYDRISAKLFNKLIFWLLIASALMLYLK